MVLNQSDVDVGGLFCLLSCGILLRLLTQHVASVAEENGRTAFY